MSKKLFVLNLGGTSTKASIFEDDRQIATLSEHHSEQEMAENPTSAEQVNYRRQMIEKFLKDEKYEVTDFDAFVMRSPPVKVECCGTYLVEGKIREKLLEFYHPDQKPEHGNRFALPLLEAMRGELDTPIYLVDPPNIDEYWDIAHVSGIPGYPRKPGFHVLNQKAVARKYADSIGKRYSELKLVVVHMGGGISIAAHEYGRTVESDNAGEGWGPFSTNRAGTVAAKTMLELCFDKGLEREQVHRLIRGDCGLQGLLGTTDLREIEKRIEEGDAYADLVYRAMVMQIAEGIGGMFAVLKGKIDAIIFTGGMAYSEKLIASIKKYVGSLAPIAVIPGEMEQEALAMGAYRVLTGKEEPVTLK